jgi:hypothetical protein
MSELPEPLESACKRASALAFEISDQKEIIRNLERAGFSSEAAAGALHRLEEQFEAAVANAAALLTTYTLGPT